MSNQNALIQRTIANQQLPADRPKFVLLPFNFTTLALQAVDLLQYAARGFISAIQTMYVDNSTNTASLVFKFGQPSAQSIIVPAGAQGYFSILVPEPYFIVSTTGTPANIQVMFLKVPIAPSVWFPATASPLFDGSGNLKTADQNLIPYLGVGGIQIQNGGLG